ncbi:MAG TPA: hypothetical protein VGM09_11905 [Bradyrhizobium sp.]
MAADGRLIYRRNDGPTDTNEIVDAQPGESGIIIFHLLQPKYNETRENGIAMQADGSTRTVYNRGADGQYSVRDSTFAANGMPTPSLHRCR